MRPSANVDHLEGSATMAVAALCRELKAQGREILDLSAGEPDFRTPAFAAEAGIAAIEQGFTQYAPVAGIAPLREAIAQHFGRLCGRDLSPSGVVVSVGAKQAMFNACFCLFGPGDDVLIPVPYWTSYPEMVRLARANPVLVRPDDDAGLRISVADLDAALTPRTRGLLLNSPGNPSGVVYSTEELRALVGWAAERGIIVVSDEIYGRICFDGERAPSVLDLEPELLEQVVMVDGASKAFAMTGWRVGFSYSSPDVAALFANFQSHVTSGATTPAQYAAITAFRDEPRVLDAVQAMVRVFRRRRDAALALLHERAPEIGVTRPDGAFFLFLRVDALYRDGIRDSVEFCHRLLDRTGVALVPGHAFGDDRYVRLSFASPEAEILEGIDRLAATVTEPQFVA